MLSKIEGSHDVVIGPTTDKPVIYIYDDKNAPDDNRDDKPVIYTYPEKPSNIRVSIDNKDGLTCVYPKT